ncbi:MAG TPA: hypothetical protein VG871_21450 [Vicinamibacterales bacterium]|nr:hypothetical protein [Vicinamibacterales bacterium]
MPKSSSGARACSTGPAPRGAWVTRLLCVATLTLAAAPCDAALTGAGSVATAYSFILAAQFERADANLARTCPPAPVEACRVLEAVSLWWRIQIDPTNRTRDQRFNQRAAAAIASTAAWTKREPGRAEAWFYYAASYAPLVQWQILRGERIAAARNGNRIREALEQTLRLDPALADAHFGIGLYEYYADVASPAAKVFRWLLMLPGGDRVKGLKAIHETEMSGALLRDEAEFQLYQIDIWYEHKPGEALAVLKSLDEHYPFNPLFLQRMAELYDTYLHDARASAAAWQQLADRAHHDRVYDAPRIAMLADRKRREIVARNPKIFDF